MRGQEGGRLLAIEPAFNFHSHAIDPQLGEAAESAGVSQEWIPRPNEIPWELTPR
jgi:hypothetical protein